MLFLMLFLFLVSADKVLRLILTILIKKRSVRAENVWLNEFLGLGPSKELGIVDVSCIEQLMQMMGVVEALIQRYCG